MFDDDDDFVYTQSAQVESAMQHHPPATQQQQQQQQQQQPIGETPKRGAGVGKGGIRRVALDRVADTPPNSSGDRRALQQQNSSAPSAKMSSARARCGDASLYAEECELPLAKRRVVDFTPADPRPKPAAMNLCGPKIKFGDKYYAYVYATVVDDGETGMKPKYAFKIEREQMSGKKNFAFSFRPEALEPWIKILNEIYYSAPKSAAIKEVVVPGMQEISRMVPDENGVLDWNTLKPLKMYTDTVFKLDDHEIFVGSNSFVRDGGETVEYTALMIKKLACESNNLSNDLT